MKLRRNISIGDNGEDVLYLQTKMKQYGLYSGILDGIYNNLMLKSIRELQEKLNLEQTDTITILFWHKFKLFFNPNEDNNESNSGLNRTISKDVIFTNLIIDDKLYYKTPTKKKNIKIDINHGIDNIEAASNCFNKIKIKNKDYFEIPHFIISGDNIYSLFNDSYWAYNSLTKAESMSTIYISICNLGKLKSGLNCHYYSNQNSEVENVEMVNDIVYEKISETKKSLLLKLINYIKSKNDIEKIDILCDNLQLPELESIHTN